MACLEHFKGHQMHLSNFLAVFLEAQSQTWNVYECLMTYVLATMCHIIDIYEMVTKFTYLC